MPQDTPMKDESCVAVEAYRGTGKTATISYTDGAEGGQQVQTQVTVTQQPHSSTRVADDIELEIRTVDPLTHKQLSKEIYIFYEDKLSLVDGVHNDGYKALPKGSTPTPKTAPRARAGNSWEVTNNLRCEVEDAFANWSFTQDEARVLVNLAGTMCDAVITDERFSPANVTKIGKAAHVRELPADKR